MDAPHAQNNVRVLAIEWPGSASTGNATAAEAHADPTITTSDFPNSLITSDDEENVFSR